MAKVEFGQIYEANRQIVSNYLLHRTNYWDSEDVLQQTFLKGMLCYDNLDPAKGKIKNWLLTIAHHTLVDNYRLRDNRNIPLDSRLTAPESQNPQIVAEQHLMAEKVREAVEQLPPYPQKLVKMYYFDQLSQAEIAESLGKSKDAVKMALFAARKRLERLLAGER